MNSSKSCKRGRMTEKGITPSEKKKPAFLHPIERFITSNDLKLVWLAREVGVSPEMLRYYFRNDALPDDLAAKAVSAINKKGKRLADFRG